MLLTEIRSLAASVGLLLASVAQVMAGTIDIAYGINLGGAQIMAADFSATLSGDRYTGTVTAKTTGVSKLFSKSKYALTTEGKVKSGRLHPVVHDYQRLKNGKQRVRKLAFEGQKLVTDGQDYPASALPALTKGLLDPITAVFAMTQLQKPCNYRTRVFDGRDVYDIATTPQGGNASRPVCTLIYKPVAGDDVDEGNGDSQTYEITFVQAAGDFTFLPISLTGSSKGLPFDVTASSVRIDGAAFSY